MDIPTCFPKQFKTKETPLRKTNKKCENRFIENFDYEYNRYVGTDGYYGGPGPIDVYGWHNTYPYYWPYWWPYYENDDIFYDENNQPYVDGMVIPRVEGFGMNKDDYFWIIVFFIILVCIYKFYL